MEEESVALTVQLVITLRLIRLNVSHVPQDTSLLLSKTLVRYVLRVSSIPSREVSVALVLK